MMAVKFTSELADEITAFDRGMLISYPEMLAVLDRLNCRYRQTDIEARFEEANPMDLPGGSDWPDAWASHIWREIQSDRVRKMDS